MAAQLVAGGPPVSAVAPALLGATPSPRALAGARLDGVAVLRAPQDLQGLFQAGFWAHIPSAHVYTCSSQPCPCCRSSQRATPQMLHLPCTRVPPPLYCTLVPHASTQTTRISVSCLHRSSHDVACCRSPDPLALLYLLAAADPPCACPCVPLRQQAAPKLHPLAPLISCAVLITERAANLQA